jgi:ribosomal protein S18 acetylase RimI-like enzyme
MTVIIPLESMYCKQVSQLHLEYLTSDFKGKPGERLLQAYYKSVMVGQGATSFVAMGAGQVLGYICGVWDPVQLQCVLLARHGMEVALWGFLQVLSRPRILLSLKDHFHRSKDGSTDGGYELRPIVVHPLARGTGVASKLVDMLRKDAAQRGFRKIYLYTEIDNKVAQRFYRKMGFFETASVIYAGAPCLRFERDVLG